MSNMGREIPEFPFSRNNAEQIKLLGQTAITAQANLINYMKKIGSDETEARIHLLFEFSAVEAEEALNGMIQKTFPELTPIDWGFSK